MINVKWLHALRAVVSNGSVTAAAEQLHITQPAVSRMIANLEEELGFALFERHRGRLSITAQGEAFYREVERALAPLDELSRTGKSIRQGAGTILRLIAMSSAAHEVIPNALLAFRQDYPSVITSLEVRGGREVTQWGVSRHFDLGVVLVPRGYVLGNAISCADMRFSAVLPSDHPLAACETLTLTRLAAGPLVMLATTGIIRRWLDSQFAQVQKIPSVIVETSSMTTAAQYAARGLGIAIVDPLAIRSIASTGFTVRPLDPPLEVTLTFVLPVERAPTPMVARLIELIRTAAAKILAQIGPHGIPR